MPIYVYQPDSSHGCRHCRDGFEQLQKVEAAPLTRCPRCAGPVRRMITAPNLASAKPDLSEKNIARHGFTQYRKVEQGVYEKTAGAGPEVIRKED